MRSTHLANRSKARARLLARPWIAAILIGLMACAGSDIHAQPSPSNIQSGTVSGTGGTTFVTLFNVPSGSDFVLTDLEWVPDMNINTSVLRLPLMLWSNGGACIIGPKAQWFALLFDDTNGGRHTVNLPLQVHWSTGIVFCPSTQVQMNIGDLNALTAWRINWSGYTVPSGTSAVEETGRPNLALEIVPNPASKAARIEFQLPLASSVVLGIFDVQGRRVRTLFEGALGAGTHSLEWDGRGDDGKMVRDGMYLAQLETPHATRREKLTRVR